MQTLSQESTDLIFLLLEKIKGLLRYACMHLTSAITHTIPLAPSLPPSSVITQSMVGNSTKLSFAERLTWLEITVERREPGSPKIQRVAQHLLPDRMHYEKHYMPMKLMSFDHIHYGAPKLQLGEQYGKLWAAM